MCGNGHENKKRYPLADNDEICFRAQALCSKQSRMFLFRRKEKYGLLVKMFGVS